MKGYSNRTARQVMETIVGDEFSIMEALSIADQRKREMLRDQIRDLEPDELYRLIDLLTEAQEGGAR